MTESTEAPSGMEPEPRWLDADEYAAWAGLVTIMVRLPTILDTQLQRDAGITHFEFGVLAALSQTPDHTMQMTKLAALASGTLSRLSHIVSRLEKRGYVRRSRCDGGIGRATNATLTEAGHAKVVEAAPGHVDTVRRLVIDALTSRQLKTMAAIGRRVQLRLDPVLPGTA